MTGEKKRKQNLILIIAILLVSLVFLPLQDLVFAQESGSVSLTRLWGNDRYETAVRVVRAGGVRYSDTVILARGDDAGDFADSLAAGVLSGIFDAPVLLTPPDSLPPGVLTAIDEMHADTVYILGGEAAVSRAIEDQLAEKGYRVERIAGANRYETAAEIALKVEDDLTSKAYIVSGTAPADSLVVGPAAADRRCAVLQVTLSQVPQVTVDALERLDINRVVIVGGTAVVGEEVEEHLKELLGNRRVSRIQGDNRIETSLAFAREEFPDHTGVIFVGKNNIVDGIAGSYLGNLADAPIIYMDKDAVPRGIIEAMSDNPYLERVYLLGGDAAISLKAETEVRQKILGEIQEEELPPEPPSDRPASPYFTVKDGKLYGYDFWHNEVYLTEAPEFLAPGYYYTVDKDDNFYRWEKGKAQKDLEKVGQFNYREQIPYLLLNLNIPAEVTAGELNNMIKKTNPSSPLASKGKEFIKAQETWGINAVYLVAHAALESAWGTSKIAREKNNYFGYRAYDADPFDNAATFTDLEQCLLYVSGYIKKHYLTAGGWFANGPTLAGMNVRYATDPMWGVKIANIMERLAPWEENGYPQDYDPPALGGIHYLVSNINPNVPLDLKTPVNIRSGPSTDHEIVVKLPFATRVEVLDKQTNGKGELWYNVFYSTPEEEGEGWVRYDYLLLH